VTIPIKRNAIIKLGIRNIPAVKQLPALGKFRAKDVHGHGYQENNHQDLIAVILRSRSSPENQQVQPVCVTTFSLDISLTEVTAKV
jgi:hypothetical protein